MKSPPEIVPFLVKLIDSLNTIHEELSLSDESQEMHFAEIIKSRLEDAETLLFHQLMSRGASTKKSIESPSVSVARKDKSSSVSVARKDKKSIKSSKSTFKFQFPDEVLDLVFSYRTTSAFQRPNDHASLYNGCLVSKAWNRVAKKKLWQRDVRLDDLWRMFVFGRGLKEMKQYSQSINDPSWFVGDKVQCIQVNESIQYHCDESIAFVTNWINHLTRHLVFIDLVSLSNQKIFNLSLFYEFLSLHPRIKRVVLDHVFMDTTDIPDNLPELETCVIRFLDYEDYKTVESREILTAQCIHLNDVCLYKKKSVKSITAKGIYDPLPWIPHFTHITHLSLIDSRSASRLSLILPQLPHLTALSLIDESPTDATLDLVAKSCSLTLFILSSIMPKWSPNALISLIRSLGPRLLSLGIPLRPNHATSHSKFLSTIAQHCPTLSTLELYGECEALEEGISITLADVQDITRLPLKWVHAWNFDKWPKELRSCQRFHQLCEKGHFAHWQDPLAGYLDPSKLSR